MTWVGWTQPIRIKGRPPIGEIEAHCAGCRARFLAGQESVSLIAGTVFGHTIYAHPDCTELVERRMVS